MVAIWRNYKGELKSSIRGFNLKKSKKTLLLDF
jgi:hypothetical protein